MKIIALPDLHGGITYLSSVGDVLLSADLVLLVGDLTNKGGTAEVAQVIESLRQFNQSLLAIPGNWDGSEVDTYLSDQQINLHCQTVVHNDIAFIGVGASLPSPSNAPNEITEEAFSLLFEPLQVSNRNSTLLKILVCHQPPFDTVNDKMWTDLHVGSRTVREFIEEVQPAICFTGHIHEGVGIDTIGFTRIINPGPIWQGGYAYTEVTSKGVVTLEIRNVSK